MQRQEVAIKNIASILSYREDTTPQNLIRYLRDLHTSSQVDFAFLTILENSYQECVKHNHDDSASVYKFALDVVERLNKSHPKPSTTASSKHNSTNTNTKSSPITTTTPSTTSINDQNFSSSSSSTTTDSSNNTISNTNANAHTFTSSCSSSSETPEFPLEALESSGLLLNQLMTECKGNAMQLKDKLTYLLQQNDLVTINPPVFLKMLTDNIEACKLAGYVNKVKLFEFMKAIITTYQSEMKKLQSSSTSTITKKRANHNDSTSTNNNDNNDNNDNNEHNKSEEEEISALLSTHHAPQFVDNQMNKKRSKLNTTNNNNTTIIEENGIEISQPTSFINGSTLMSNLLHTNMKNMKKKTEKKLEKQKANIIIQEIATHLENHSYAAVDNFLPLDLIKRVRIESGLFTNFYEQR